MLQKNPLVDGFITLQSGAIIKEVTTTPSFVYIKSKIPTEPWHNFVVVLAENPEELDGQALFDLLKFENASGIQLSLYVNEVIKNNFTDFLATNQFSEIGTDNYLAIVLPYPSEPNLPDGYVLSTSYDLTQLKKLLTDCFDGWVGEDFYSDIYDKLRNQKDPTRVFETFGIRHGDELVAAGSVVLDKYLKLAYLHNMGVALTHRRKGLFTALANHCLTFAQSFGVNEAFAITEYESGSYLALKSMGFSQKDKYHLFTLKTND